MTYKIRPKRSNVPNKVPTAADLDLGELAINMADQKIYTKTPGNTIVELGGGADTIDLLAVDSDIIPDGDLTRSLGSPSHQWADLYVGNATIYLNNVPLGLDGDQNLTFNGNVVANSDGAVVVDWTNITNAPGGIDSGNITFNGDSIGSTGDGVDVTSDGYAQLSSNGNYLWLDDSGIHVEVSNGEGSQEFKFQWNDGQAQLQLPNGADIVDSNGASVLGGGGGNPFNQTLNNNDSVQFANVRVNPTGKLTQGWNTVTRASGYEIVPAGQTVDIWTADNAEVTGAKFTVVFENRTAEPYYNNFDTLTCEIVLAKKRTGSTWANPMISVYGIVHTSDLPTVTFSAVTDINGRAVLRCTPAGGITSDCYVKVHSVEQQSPSIQNDWC